jgi:hypothetical protein
VAFGRWSGYWRDSSGFGFEKEKEEAMSYVDVGSWGDAVAKVGEVAKGAGRGVLEHYGFVEKKPLYFRPSPGKGKPCYVTATGKQTDPKYCDAQEAAGVPTLPPPGYRPPSTFGKYLPFLAIGGGVLVLMLVLKKGRAE